MADASTVQTTTALWFTLGGTLGGGFLGVVGTLGSGWRQRRHERQMYWLEARTKAFAALIATAAEWVNATFTAQRRVENDSMTEEYAKQWNDSLERYWAAVNMARLFMTGRYAHLDPQLEKMRLSANDTHGWLLKEIGLTPDEEPTMESFKVAIDTFDKERIEMRKLIAAALKL